MPKNNNVDVSPFDCAKMTSLKHWGSTPQEIKKNAIKMEAIVDCGWGRLIFGQTYCNPEALAEEILSEKPGQRDVAFYIRDPHIVLSFAPQSIFIDPSITLRLSFKDHKPEAKKYSGFIIRKSAPDDEPSINRIYLARNMVPVYDGYLSKNRSKSVITVVAEDNTTGQVVGVTLGVDHIMAFNDSDNGSSLWSLAIDPQTPILGIGEAMVCYLAKLYMNRGRSFMDLSVLHDNEHAIQLYRNIGFKDVPVFCLKKRNSINEQLFIGPEKEERFNIYAGIIVKEARRRGIDVEVLDAEEGYFKLSLGGRSITCRESLSELTTAIAISRCDNKSVTRSMLADANLKVPDQITVENIDEARPFIVKYNRVVVKPVSGEQGRYVFVDLSTRKEIEQAVKNCISISGKAILEEYVEGEDLRIIVINNEMVAAAIRRPATIIGNGRNIILELIEKQSRRRQAATCGESSIPIDDETRRCVRSYGYTLEDVLPEDVVIPVRKTANLHTGGTIHDVTDELRGSVVEEAAIRAAKVLEIPVVGLDFIVPDLKGNEYAIIEANERPGLANHEPQPTAERFIDFLFPRTKVA